MTDEDRLRNLRVGWEIEVSIDHGEAGEHVVGTVTDAEDGWFRIATGEESRQFSIPLPAGHSVRVISQEGELDIETVGTIHGHYEPALDALEDDEDATRVESRAESILGTPEAADADSDVGLDRLMRNQQAKRDAQAETDGKIRIATIHTVPHPMDVRLYSRLLLEIGREYPGAVVRAAPNGDTEIWTEGDRT